MKKFTIKMELNEEETEYLLPGKLDGLCSGGLCLHWDLDEDNLPKAVYVTLDTNPSAEAYKVFFTDRGVNLDGYNEYLMREVRTELTHRRARLGRRYYVSLWAAT